MDPATSLDISEFGCSAPTSEEQRLWLLIRGCQLGVWCRRQVPLGSTIVDFLDPSAHLIVEVEGGSHRTRRASDARRDAKLANMGYRVVMLETEVVCHRIEDALECIRIALGT